MKFGEHLARQTLISEDQLQAGLETQRYRPGKLGRTLRDLGILDQERLNCALQEFLLPNAFGSHGETLKDLEGQCGAGPFAEWADRFGLIPWNRPNETNYCFLSPTFRDEAVESFEQTYSRTCELILIERDSYDYLRKRLAKEPARSNVIALSARATDDQRISEADPYTSLMRDVLQSARNVSASDVHIQPTREGVDIRFRVHGDMYLWKRLSVEHRQSFLTEAKRLSNLSIAVSGRAQDSRISLPNWKLDLRASLLPAQYGEKIVLRLLDLTRQFGLDELGFDEATREDLLEALEASHGVLVVSGPTGSGKTTTLYTLLCAIDRSKRNVITLEDPIEYGIDGLTQVQVSPKLGFSDALRAVLRQDPDVILVGEIRDRDTADLCIKAASTGHLVLSTLHANGAKEVIGRLLSLGVDPYLLRSCLRFSAAQRLVKRLCPACSVSAPTTAWNELSAKLQASGLALQEAAELRVAHPGGCSQCRMGFTGRIPVLEYMRRPEVQSYLDQAGQANTPLARSLKHAALRFGEKGEVDAYDLIHLE